jgi:hypothetical protein
MMFCPQCGEIIVETVLGREADKVIHRYTRHDPVAGLVFSVIASVIIASAVTAAWKALR